MHFVILKKHNFNLRELHGRALEGELNGRVQGLGGRSAQEELDNQTKKKKLFLAVQSRRWRQQSIHGRGKAVQEGEWHLHLR